MYYRFLRFIFACVLLLGWVLPAPAFDLPRIKVTMMMEHEDFLMWYAKKQGLINRLE